MPWRCRVEWHGATGNIAADVRIEFRIGVNLGDVIVEKGDVFGDGVNIAARLEQIAPPGGICLSEDAYRQVGASSKFPSPTPGSRTSRTFRTPSRSIASSRQWRQRSNQKRCSLSRNDDRRCGHGRGWRNGRDRFGGDAWFSLPRAPHGVSQSAEPAKPIASIAIPVIAVLPFANQTGDEGQEYFADGVTEEVINALGRFNTLRVIGRNAVLPYKKRPATREEVVSELGANYLVGGSVRPRVHACVSLRS